MKVTKTYRVDQEVLEMIEQIKVDMLINNDLKLNNTEVIELAVRRLVGEMEKKYTVKEIVLN